MTVLSTAKGYPEVVRDVRMEDEQKKARLYNPRTALDLVRVLICPTDEQEANQAKDDLQHLRSLAGTNLDAISRRVREMIEDAKIEVKPLDPKFLFRVVEAACMETNPLIQERWAALVANFAATNGGISLLIVFVDVLKQLNADELGWMDQVLRGRKPEDLPGNLHSVLRGNLVRLGLLEEGNGVETSILTPFGEAFITACQSPAERRPPTSNEPRRGQAYSGHKT